MPRRRTCLYNHHGARCGGGARPRYVARSAPTLPGTDTALTNALACLYRINDHCWLTVYRDAPGSEGAQLHLSAVNASGAAYAVFVLGAPFFERIRICEPLFECQVHVKVRTYVALAYTDTPRRVPRAWHGAPVHYRARRAREPAGRHTRMRAWYVACASTNAGVRKRHRLTFEDRASLFPSVDAASPNYICVSAHTAREWTEQFLASGRQGECSLHCAPGACVLRSRLDAPLEGKGAYSTTTDTSAQLHSQRGVSRRRRARAVRHTGRSVRLLFALGLSRRDPCRRNAWHEPADRVCRGRRPALCALCCWRHPPRRIHSSDYWQRTRRRATAGATHTHRR